MIIGGFLIRLGFPIKFYIRYIWLWPNSIKLGFIWNMIVIIDWEFLIYDYHEELKCWDQLERRKKLGFCGDFWKINKVCWFLFQTEIRVRVYDVNMKILLIWLCIYVQDCLVIRVYLLEVIRTYTFERDIRYILTLLVGCACRLRK